MDKLQPLITHIFWILFGVALLLPTVGWWMGTGTLQARIEEQEKAIDGAFKEVAGNKQSPNNRWTEGLTKINQQEEQKYQLAALELQGTQNDLRTWHESIAPMLKDIPYQGPILDPTPRDEFRKQAYWEEIERLEKIVNPYNPMTNTGLVILTQTSIPKVPDNEWQLRLPESDEMWKLQEDIWLMRGLLKSIASLNTGDVITESAVREITSLTLHGGDLNALNEGGGSASSPSNMEGPSFKGGYPNARQGTSLDILPEKVFGPQTAKDAASSGGSESNAETGRGMMGRGAVALDRYVDEEEGMPFKTRGFILKVIMDHRKVPELLVALTNCEWPGQILHVNQVDLHQDQGGSTTHKGSTPYLAGRGSFGAGGGGNEGFDPTMMEQYAQEDNFFDGGEGSDLGGGPGPRVRATNPAASASAAMADSFLAEVHVAGLLTIYDPPPADALAAVDGSAAPPDAGQPAVPADAGTAPTDGSNTAAPQVAPANGPADAPSSTDPAGGTTPAVPEGTPTPSPTNPTDPATPPSGQQPGEAIN